MEVDADDVSLDRLDSVALLVEQLVDGIIQEVDSGTVYVSQDVVVNTDLDGVTLHFGQW